MEKNEYSIILKRDQKLKEKLESSALFESEKQKIAKKIDLDFCKKIIQIKEKKLGIEHE